MQTKDTKQSISKIFKKRDRIDLDPFFQREKVWNKERKQLFVDTILKKWGIPKIYLLVTENDGKKDYTCLDGKQRLSAIFDFISNQYPASQKYNVSIGDKFYKDLSEKTSDEFDDYELPIEEVSDASPDEISELFKRLQLGVPLNSGEKLTAIGGFLADEIRKLNKHNFFANKVSIANTRSAYFVICTQIAFLEVNGITDLNLRKLEDFLKLNDDESKIGFDIKNKIKKIGLVLDYLDKVFAVKSDILKNRATIVSFYLLISMFIGNTNINGKESKFKLFFDRFSKELNKQINLGTKGSDPALLQYQNSVIQGADKQKAIKNRQEIVLQKLLDYDKSLYKLINPSIDPRETFTDLYSKIEKKFKTQEIINNWIIKNDPSVTYIKCAKTRGLSQKETSIVHIRNCINHKEHGIFTSQQLSSATKSIKDLITKL